MFSIWQFTGIVTGMLLLVGTAVNQHELTTSDIPTDLSPEITLLIEQTFSSDGKERALAARKLGAIHESTSSIVPFLIRLLDDPYSGDLYVPYEAQKAIVALGDEAVEPVIAASKAPLKGRRGEKVIECLGRFKHKYPRALNTLLALLEDKDPNVRLSAAKALCGCTDKHATLPLIKALDDPDSRVRRAAAECFLSIRDKRAVEPLLKALKKRRLFDAELLDPVIAALGHQQDQLAVPPLLSILRNQTEDRRLRRTAAISLGMIGGQSTFPDLAEVFWDERAPTITRAGAIQAIAMFKDEDSALIMLNNLLFSDAPIVTYELKIYVVKAMAAHGDPQAVDALTRVVWNNGRNELAFWAAMSAVKLTDGAIDDIGIVRAIQDYKCSCDGEELYGEEKRNALQKLAKNGTTWRVRLAARDQEYMLIAVPIGCAVAVIGIAVMLFVIWRYRRKRKVGNKKEV